VGKDASEIPGAVLAALEGLCVGVVVTSVAGRVTWTNRVAQRILGIDPARDHGRPLARLLHDPQLAEFWHRAGTGEETVLGEGTLHEPRTAELKVNATPSFDADGRLAGRALMFCDLTHERTVQVALSREATQRLLDLTERWNDDGDSHDGLTPSEVRILRGVGGGLSNPQIAKRLHTAPATVRSHLKHVYRKIGVASRSEAISYAIRHGLVENPHGGRENGPDGA